MRLYKRNAIFQALSQGLTYQANSTATVLASSLTSPRWVGPSGLTTSPVAF